MCPALPPAGLGKCTDVLEDLFSKPFHVNDKKNRFAFDLKIWHRKSNFFI
jgi:hypothetical protein